MPIDRKTYDRATLHAGVYNATKRFSRILAQGNDVLDLLHRLTTNDLKPLEANPGHAVTTVLTNEKARFIDIIHVIRESDGGILLITSAEHEQAVIDRVKHYVIMEDAHFSSIAAQIAQFIMSGPKATAILQSYATTPLDPTSNAVYECMIDDVPVTLTRHLDLTGSSWTILTHASLAEQLWRSLAAKVTIEGGIDMNDELYELVRIERGMPAAPNEINDRYNPLEIPIASEIISFTKGCYIGQEVIARLDAQNKVQRHAMRLELQSPIEVIEGQLASTPMPLRLVADGTTECGDFTSYVASPVSNHIVGIGFVRGKFSKDGGDIAVKLPSGELLPAIMSEIATLKQPA